MSWYLPSQSVLQQAFGPTTLGLAVPTQHRKVDNQASWSQPSRQAPFNRRPDLYPAFSTVDDAKKKAQKLSAEATREFEKASAKAQAAAGPIELFSAKYYAACTFGGLLACVRKHCPFHPSCSQMAIPPPFGPEGQRPNR